MAAKNYIFKEVALQNEKWSVRMYSYLLDYEKEVNMKSYNEC